MKYLYTTLIVIAIVAGYLGISYARDITEIVNDNRPTILYEKTANGVVSYVYVSDIEAVAESGEIIEKRTNNTVFLSDNKIKIYAGRPFYKTQGKWYHTEVATSTVENYKKITKKLSINEAYAVSLFSTAGDGYIESKDIVTHSWDVAHDASIGTSVSYTGSSFLVGTNTTTGAIHYYSVFRGSVPFDTSSIVSSEEINSASVFVYSFIASSIDQDKDGNNFIGLVENTTASSTILTTSDFNEYGATNTPTLLSNTITITTLKATAQYYEFVLNDLTKIKKNGEVSTCGVNNGTTCLGFREGHDTNDDAPDGGSFASLYSSGWAGTDRDPYILIDVGSCTYSGSGDWYIKATDNCYLSDDTWVEGDIHILADEGSGSVNLIDDVIIGAYSIQNTSTPINMDAGTKIELYE